MRTWVVRFASLYVFNVVVLWIIGLLLPPVHVGWAALWASVLLTAATIWLKPAIAKIFRSAVRKSSASRTALSEHLVQYGVVFVVELIIWVLVVVFSGVGVHGFFWGWVIPPLLLLVAWAIYSAVDDRIEQTAGDLYDSAAGRLGHAPSGAAPEPAPTDPTLKAELDDGLTPEQRKMLDELGS